MLFFYIEVGINYDLLINSYRKMSHFASSAKHQSKMAKTLALEQKEAERLMRENKQKAYQQRKTAQRRQVPAWIATRNAQLKIHPQQDNDGFTIVVRNNRRRNSTAPEFKRAPEPKKAPPKTPKKKVEQPLAPHHFPALGGGNKQTIAPQLSGWAAAAQRGSAFVEKPKPKPQPVVEKPKDCWSDSEEENPQISTPVKRSWYEMMEEDDDDF